MNKRYRSSRRRRTPQKYTKSAGIAAKKISDRYKKLRGKRNINIVEEIKDVASKKSAQIAAKKVSDKYKKMRLKKPPTPSPLPPPPPLPLSL